MKKQYLIATIGLILAGCGGSDSSNNNEDTGTAGSLARITGTIEQIKENGIMTPNRL